MANPNQDLLKDLEAALLSAEGEGRQADVKAIAGDMNKLIESMSAQKQQASVEPEAPEDPGMLENAKRAAVSGSTATAGFLGEITNGVAWLGRNLAAITSGGRVTAEQLKANQEELANQGKAVPLFINSPTEEFRNLAEMFGLRSDPVKGLGFGRDLATNTVEALSGSLSFGGIGVLSTTGRKVIAERGLKGLAAAEGTAATAGSVARTGAEQLTGQDSMVSTAAEIITNIYFNGRANALRAGKDYIAKKLAEKPAAFKEAARVARANVELHGGDSKATAAKLAADTDEGAENLSAAQRTQDSGLLALEHEMVTKDPLYQARFTEARDNVLDFIRNGIRGVMGDGEISDDIIDAFRYRAETVTQTAERAYQSAFESLKGQLEELPPVPGIASRKFKETFEKVTKHVKETEDEAWSALSGQSNPQGAVDDLNDIFENASAVDKARPEKALPDIRYKGVMKDLAEQFEANGFVDAMEVQSVRSAVLSDLREASRDGNGALVRQLGRFADSLETVLLDATDSLDQEGLKNARKITREFANHLKGNSEIAKLARRGAQGQALIPDNETLDRIFVSGEKGATNVAALSAMMQDKGLAEANDGVEMIQQYALARFYKAATDGNSKPFTDLEAGVDFNFSAASARSFVKRFGPALKELGLETHVNAIMKSADEALTEQGVAKMVLTREARSKASKVFGFGDTVDGYEDMVEGIRVNVIKSTSPAKALKELKTKLDDIADPDVEAGVRAAVGESIISHIFTKAGRNLSENIGPDTERFAKAMVDSGMFSAEEADRLRKIANIGVRQMETQNVNALKGQAVTAQKLGKRRMISGVAQWIALKLASKFGPGGGGQIKAASAASRFAQSLALEAGSAASQEILREAMFDPKLMEALLTQPINMTDSKKKVVMDVLMRTGASGSLMQALNPERQ